MARKQRTTGRISNGDYPIEKPFFVLQVQEKKDGKWEDTEPGWDEWYDERSALRECRDANKGSVRDAKEEYQRPPFSPNNQHITIFKGQDLEVLLSEVKRAHKKVNPKNVKRVEKPPFDPASAWPKYRVVSRTLTENVVGD